VRVLVISNLYPSAAHPGFGTFVAAHVEALRAQGVDVRVVANRDPRVHRGIVTKYGSLGRATARATLGTLKRGQHIDVIEAHIAYPTGMIARPAARLLGAPLVLHAHGADVLAIPERSTYHRRLARSTFGAASVIVANSRFLAGEISQRFPGVTDRVSVISPGIEFDRFTADGSEPRWGVLFVGRLIPEKGVDVLIRAMAPHGTDADSGDVAPTRLPFPTLTILGDGPERPHLRELAAELGVSLELRGDAPPAIVAAAMRRAQVVVVPSVYREPLGLVAIEAMASGAIVVASATGGLIETVLDGETGLTAPAGDPRVLRQTIGRALAISTDPIAGPAMRAAGRRMAASHDIRRSATACIALYGTLPR
jgi:glycosyltransferase involved in cell wall biosynthesis